MARKKKELSPADFALRRKSQERVKAYLTEKKLSCQGLANKLSVSEGTIRNYVHGRSYMTFQIAQLFEQRTGIVYEYWMGLADYRTAKDREKEAQILMGAAWDAADDSLDGQRKEDADRRIFFSKCGFTYENLSFPPGPLEFSDADDSGHPLKAYRLTSSSAPALSADFTDAEIDAIFSRLQATLHDLIELEVYRKDTK